jgi:hypothetical protein
MFFSFSMALLLSAHVAFLEPAQHVGKNTRSKSYREEFDSASSLKKQ